MAFEQTETQVHIPTAEGINLSATYHCAGDSQLGSVLICPAMGVTAKFYTPFARFLCDQGFHVLRIDYRGMGASLTEPMRVCPATMRSWAEVDIAAALVWIRQQLPANPIAAVGHSAGGQLAGISNSSIPVHALLMVASQSGHWRLWSGFKRTGMWLLWQVVLPGLTNLCGRFPASALKLGKDLPRGVALQWAKWGRSKKYIASDAELAERYSKYTGSILAFSFSDDNFAPAAAVEELLSFYSSASIEHRIVEPHSLSQKKIGHFGFFREWVGKESLWTDSANWLKSELKP